MHYAADLENGQRLAVEKDDGNGTMVTLSSGSEGQQQSQRTGFTTGEWASPPTLFRVGGDHLLKVNTVAGARFILVRGNQIRSVKGEPDLEDAEEVPLREAAEQVGPEPMRPMHPMSPMGPMGPMKPMQPLEPMPPMEMQMGNMRMSMGSREAEEAPEKRFCTQCGKPVGKNDRFCAYCGAKIGTE